jgi:phospholipid/cholesterol/gamma-HCH transport system ATP-binding protein
MRLRGRSGRVSPDFGWISSLDLEDNVVLSQRHRTTRPNWEIRAEARRWAQAFGLPDGLPPGRPETIARDVLRRAACGRAFLGDPALIVVDTASDRAFSPLYEPLIEACNFLRGRRAAVLWLADRRDTAALGALNPTVARSLSSAGTESVPPH